MASNTTLYNQKTQIFPRGHAPRPLQLSTYTPALHNISGRSQTHTHTHAYTHTHIHTHTHTRAHACTHAHTHMCAHVRIHTGTHCITIEKALFECENHLEWSKMASNATLSHLKTRIFPGGACPRPPLVSYVYIYI